MKDNRALVGPTGAHLITENDKLGHTIRDLDRLLIPLFIQQKERPTLE